jgi:preprotein translocase subunit SecY
VIFVLEGVRKIPVQYAKRVVGRRVYGGQATFLPMKINQAGVIPVIFAQSLVIFPETIARFIGGDGWFVRFVSTYLTPGGPGGWLYWTLYLLMIFGFTYFYTSITFNPKDVAENLRKQGGFIPGIRPGGPTVEYLMRLSNRITFLGALFLAVISAVPTVIILATGVQNAYLGGTSLLIVVGVGLETMKQIQAQLIMRHYQGFIRG